MTKKKAPTPDLTNSRKPSVPLVAIGASAGGLEALTQLLKELSPTTGLAYAYIQHPDPDNEGPIRDILSRFTSMPVLEAAPLVQIEPNHVYIIPSETNLEVFDGVISQLPSRPGSAIHLPIDRFFSSLAERQQEGSIGVLLSGTGDDGTQGLKAIKASGGISIVQDESARYKSMPKSAIGENVVDMVLSPREIAVELERLSRQTDIFLQTAMAAAEEEDLVSNSEDNQDEDLKAIIQLLRKTSGVDFRHYKITTIRRRIIRRMLLYKLETLKEYGNFLKQNPAEAAVLYNDLLINVTTFFRDTETMDYLKDVVFPQLIKNKAPREPFRVWIPACSTGQEAYSLAILLLESLGNRAGSSSIQIFATDLSEPAITKARAGLYSRSEVIDVSPKRLQRFFMKVDDHYRINKNIRDLCVFARHNVLKDPPFSRLDLVSCRNLMIYLDTVLQRKVLGTFHYALSPSGYLLLGKSETVGNSGTLFSQIEKNHKLFIRKNDVTSRPAFEINIRYPESEPMEEAHSPAISRKTVDATDLDKVIDTLLLNQYVPPSVVVDQNLEIIQFRGSTGLFLEPAPGRASFNLLKMARPSLAFELRNAVHKARKSGQSVRKSGLEITVKDRTHTVAIEAVPLKTEEPLFLILFEEVLPTSLPENSSATARNHRIKQLEEELATLRQDMHSIIEEQEASNEELQSANEEIISSNEELQSINEELETSKEEIESTNEELLTINQELQVRNDQLSEAYEYAETIFGTIREATVVLDKDLRVKSANRAFYQLFQIPEDATEGRMFYELGNRQWDILSLRQLLEEIITQDASIRGMEMTVFIPESGEKIVRLNARRVVRQQSQEAILLAIEDITEHRRAQRLVEEREAWFHALVDNSPALTWVAGPDGAYTYLNKAWLDFTGRRPEDETGDGWSQGIHPDDRESYRSNYRRYFESRQPFQSEYRLRRRDKEYRWMLENAKPLVDPDGNFRGYIGTCAEVHSQKAVNQELDKRVRERTEALATVNTDLKNVNELLRSILKNTPDRITRWDRELNLEFANAALQETDHPDDTALPYREKLRQVFETGQAQDYYNSFVTSHGHRFYYTRMVPEPGPDGSVQSVLAIARDITQLKQAEEKWEETAQNLQAVLDGSPAAVGLLKAVREEADGPEVDFRLAVCNQQYAQLSDLPIDELIGRSAARLFPNHWQSEPVDRIRQVFSTGESYYFERQWQPGQSMETRWLGISITQQDDGVMLTALDITELKQSQEQQEFWLQELARSAETLEGFEKVRRQVRERGEFLRSTTHDLRGSFGVLQGAASILNLMNSEEERAPILEMLHRNLRQVTQMMTQLLDYSRLESGQEQLDVSPYDAAELLKELSRSANTLAAEKGLWVRSEGPDTLPVEGDSVKVHRIAQNLLLNAIKYTHTGGITVRWKEEDADHWSFTIEDTGVGMSREVALTLLNTRGTSTQGSLRIPESGSGSPASVGLEAGEGIGLSIVRQLCELLAARPEVEVIPGSGTQIQIVLPRRYPNNRSVANENDQ